MSDKIVIRNQYSCRVSVVKKTNGHTPLRAIAYIQARKMKNSLTGAEHDFSKKSGVISKMVADQIGIAAMMLGAGRRTKEEAIDYAVGLYLNKKVGDSVEEGESLVTIYANREDVEDVKKVLYDNIEIGESGQEPVLIHKVITE